MRHKLIAVFLVFSMIRLIHINAQSANPHPMAPGFFLKDLNNHPLSLNEFQEKVVALVIWQANCVLCEREIHNLVKIQDTYRSLGFAAVGLYTDKDPQTANGLYLRLKMNFPATLPDPKTIQRLGNPLPPTIFLIGRDGRIYAKHSGYVPASILEEEIKQLINAKATASVVGFRPGGKPEKIQISSESEINDEIPGIDLTKLKPEQLKLLEQSLDAKKCPCPCGNTMLSCRRKHGSCPMSLDAAKAELQRTAGKSN
jgi:glutathione peroxidase-family protein